MLNRSQHLCKRNILCLSFVLTCSTFSLLMHSMVDTHWSRITTSNAPNTIIEFGIWKFYTRDIVTNQILGFGKTADFFNVADSGLIIGKNTLDENALPDWLVLCWALIFATLSLNFVGMLFTLYALLKDAAASVFWFVFLQTMTCVCTIFILFVYATSEKKQFVLVGTGAMYTETFDYNFYLIAFAVFIGVTNIMVITLQGKLLDRNRKVHFLL